MQGTWMLCGETAKDPPERRVFRLKRKEKENGKNVSERLSPSDGLIIARGVEKSVKKKRTVLKDFMNMN